MTNKEQLMARVKEIMEATLGGAKYKGKENPNNEKKRNPGIVKTLLGKRHANKSRSSVAAVKHAAGAHDSNNSDHKKKRHRQAGQASDLTNPPDDYKG